MKKVFLILALLVTVTTAQSLGTLYTWVDVTDVSTTPVDSVFAVKWNNVSMYSEALDVYIRIGAPDTSGWSNREWILLKAGAVLTFPPTLYLRRVEMKTLSGTDKVYFIGSKKTAQH